MLDPRPIPDLQRRGLSGWVLTLVATALISAFVSSQLVFRLIEVAQSNSEFDGSVDYQGLGTGLYWGWLLLFFLPVLALSLYGLARTLSPIGESSDSASNKLGSTGAPDSSH